MIEVKRRVISLRFKVLSGRMPSVYSKISQEDKRRILDCHRQGGDVKALATALNVNIKSARSIARRNSSPISKRGGSKKKVAEEHRVILTETLDANPSLTLKELRQLFHEKTGITVSIATIDRYLDCHGYSLKQLSVQPVDRNRQDVKEMRKEWTDWLRADGLTTARYYIDETNFNVWCARSQGRSRIGTPAILTTTASKGANLNILACMSNRGLLTYEFVNKVTHVQFNSFLEKCSDLVDDSPATFIVDNAPAHRRMRECVLKDGHQAKRLPPYSPMFNPIEEMFSKFKFSVKHHLRQRQSQLLSRIPGRTIAEHRRQILHEVGELALSEVSPVECSNWDRHMFSFVPSALQYDDM